MRLQDIDVGAGETGRTVSDWILWAIDSPVFKWAFLIVALVMPLASLLTWAE